MQLQQYGQRVGERLARGGALGYYGVDFMVTQRREGNWAVQAIEINLRRQGTTQGTTPSDDDNERVNLGAI
ncbi:MAG: hypothetical protein ACFCBU_02185 [Cyanophyceae cyanobacterium]